MIGRLGLLAAGLLVAGCAVQHVPPTEAEIASMEWPALRADVRRGYARSFQDIPFEDGPISVVAAEGDDLRTYRLVPCGTTICAGSAHGPRGTLEVTLDYWVVRGLYGRTFFLSPGGNGGLRRAGQPDVFLAWETTEDPAVTAAASDGRPSASVRD